MSELLAALRGPGMAGLPSLAKEALLGLADEIEAIERRADEIEAAILVWHKGTEASRRLATVPGIGPITASALVATVGEASNFASARHFAAWIGLVPKQNSTGGKPRRAVSRKRGIDTCAAFWCSAPRPSSATTAPRQAKAGSPA